MNIHDILYSTWFQKNNPSWTVKSLSEANLSWANLSGANLRMVFETVEESQFELTD